MSTPTTTQPAPWIDRALGAIAPQWQLKRTRARMASELLLRHYEGAGAGRRTQGWRKSAGDANAVIGPAVTRLRENARDLVRNNPYAESALTTIVDDAVGWGIIGKPATADQKFARAWKEWAESTMCDADGKHDFAGLQKLVMRTVAESGACIVRRRLRRPEDGLPIPMQIQVLEPDFIDISKDTATLPSGEGRIIQGVQFDPIGRRSGYWLFPEHPGSASSGYGTSVFVPAASVVHVFKATRPGQVHAPTWFAPVLLRFKDFDEFEDATLMKQKIGACLAVLLSNMDGTSSPLGTTTEANPELDFLEPGLIKTITPGQTVTVVDPPQVRDYDAYSKTVLRAIATGLGVTYEDLTGDYQDMPFSAARMSRLRHERRIDDWRWRLLIPQFCDPVWGWAVQAAAIMGRANAATKAKWTPPPFAMVDPVNEGLAAQRNARTGITNLPELIRERGYDPEDLMQETAEFNKLLDKLGIRLDSDPRYMTQAGQAQQALTPETAADDAATSSRSVLHAVGGSR